MIEPKQQTILLVDDAERSRDILVRILHREGYSTLTASNGRDALDIVLRQKPDLVIMDLMMPEINGIDCTRRIRETAEVAMTPIIVLTGTSEREHRLTAIEAGVNDFLTKPVDSQELVLRIRNTLKMKEYQDMVNLLSEANATGGKLKVDELQSEIDSLLDQLDEVSDAWKEIIVAVSRALEFKDLENAGHLHRIGLYCLTLCRQLGMKEDECELVRHAAYLHDIGKMGISDKILLKAEPLSPDEWSLLKKHTIIGGRILSGESRILNIAREVAWKHHENWDGSGYPNGLKGDSIPRSARIVSIADRYDVIRTKRPYKRAYTHEEAVNIILNGDGRTKPSHFDPEVLEAFRATLDEFAEIFEAHSE